MLLFFQCKAALPKTEVLTGFRIQTNKQAKQTHKQTKQSKGSVRETIAQHTLIQKSPQESLFGLLMDHETGIQ